jgi:hypothetical protein
MQVNKQDLASPVLGDLQQPRQIRYKLAGGDNAVIRQRRAKIQKPTVGLNDFSWR